MKTFLQSCENKDEAWDAQQFYAAQLKEWGFCPQRRVGVEYHRGAYWLVLVEDEPPQPKEDDSHDTSG